MWHRTIEDRFNILEGNVGQVIKWCTIMLEPSDGKYKPSVLKRSVESYLRMHDLLVRSFDLGNHSLPENYLLRFQNINNAIKVTAEILKGQGNKRSIQDKFRGVQSLHKFQQGHE